MPTFQLPFVSRTAFDQAVARADSAERVNGDFQRLCNAVMQEAKDGRLLADQQVRQARAESLATIKAHTEESKVILEAARGIIQEARELAHRAAETLLPNYDDTDTGTPKSVAENDANAARRRRNAGERTS